ncbi:DUF3185 family protein [Wenzhouxiangella marina]|uniref:Uncharacterized protein n=1 Tax=Wenzhouxiangella marina TaxID=1579979 RepID=A0A0K0XUH5_9GAMM|nr:DUF3185 family protein [Wenzhouxiangella marina]AKS41315.1 hypothetical protein WM2015_934 [Wenzhouxiangella marina]MBB6086935.1 hypothetical protein [Wenzhouxiangella marina]
MKQKKLIGLALLIGGAVLLYFGYESSQGLDDQFSRALTGRFTDTTLIYTISGAVAGVIGLVMLLKGR